MKKIYTHEELLEFSQQVFLKIGCSPEDAAQAADVLVSADMRGVDSHGVARLSGYVRLWEAGRINPEPVIKTEHETSTTAVLDGDKGLGLVVAPKAMKTAIEKAKQYGTGWVSVNNSNHFGIAGYHSLLAVKKDMIGISMTNASPLVAPTFSRERLLGTNPIAIAIPAGKQPPFVADFATATAANGKLEILQRENKPTPSGWVQTRDGDDSTDANELKNGGALLPLGSNREHGSHKGYCLGAIVDIFSAVFSGANYGPWAPPFVSFLPLDDNSVGNGLGHFFGAMRIDAFRPAEVFKKHMDQWIERFRNAPTVKGYEKVLIPGDPERESEIERGKNGIPLHESVVNDLESLAEKFSIDF